MSGAAPGERVPAVTVGMPVYNDAAFLRTSLDSVLAQTFTDFELVISDDASSDGSDRICEEYAARDARVRFVRQPRNVGISRNMAFLRDQARSPYFAWVGDDDVWDPRFLERLLALLEGDPRAVVAFGTYALIDEGGRILGPVRDFDYRGGTAAERLGRLLRDSDDCFGYGLLRREVVADAPFPRWPWPNRDQAYNNIFPSLCHYLAKGDYRHERGAPLYLKRVKSTEGQRHNRRARGGVWELVRFTTRRGYLVAYSALAVRRAGGAFLAARTAVPLGVRWLVLPVWREWSSAMAYKLRGRRPSPDAQEANHLR